METLTGNAPNVDVADRREKWDAFLDAYSAYMRDPGLTNAASLHLAGVALEARDGRFVLHDFERRLWGALESA